MWGVYTSRATTDSLDTWANLTKSYEKRKNNLMKKADFSYTLQASSDTNRKFNNDKNIKSKI